MKFINWERKGNFKFDIYSETIALSHSHLVSLDHNVYLWVILSYFQTREDRFRHTSVSTNERVFWWSVGQIAVLLMVGLLQVTHLKRFFIAKKLV